MVKILTFSGEKAGKNYGGKWIFDCPVIFFFWGGGGRIVFENRYCVFVVIMGALHNCGNYCLSKILLFLMRLEIDKVSSCDENIFLKHMKGYFLHNLTFQAQQITKTGRIYLNKGKQTFIPQMFR